MLIFENLKWNFSLTVKMSSLKLLERIAYISRLFGLMYCLVSLKNSKISFSRSNLLLAYTIAISSYSLIANLNIIKFIIFFEDVPYSDYADIFMQVCQILNSLLLRPILFLTNFKITSTMCHILKNIHEINLLSVSSSNNFKYNIVIYSVSILSVIEAGEIIVLYIFGRLNFLNFTLKGLERLTMFILHWHYLAFSLVNFYFLNVLNNVLKNPNSCSEKIYVSVKALKKLIKLDDLIEDSRLEILESYAPCFITIIFSTVNVTVFVIKKSELFYRYQQFDVLFQIVLYMVLNIVYFLNMVVVSELVKHKVRLGKIFIGHLKRLC